MINKVILVGNLGKAPEVRRTHSGHKVANLALATNRRYKTQDGTTEEQTEWHDVVLWGKSADVAERYCDKGTCVFVEGRIQTRKWQGDDGVTRYRNEIVGQFLQLMPGGSRREYNDNYRDGGGNNYRGDRNSSRTGDNDVVEYEEFKDDPAVDVSDFDDDLPF